jgi:DNA-binding transcriptional regulator YiaG
VATKEYPAMKPELTGTEVREIRNRLGLTQAALATAIGAGKDVVRDWEREKNPCRGPSALLLQHLDSNQGSGND